MYNSEYMKWIIGSIALMLVILFWHAILVGLGIMLFAVFVGAFFDKVDRGNRAADMLGM